MSDDPRHDVIGTRFRAMLNQIYGQCLERVALFGSRARGDAQRDSDYDVAVSLRDMTDRSAEMNRLSEPATAILYEGGPYNVMPYPAGFYYDEKMPLMYPICAEGIDR